MSDNAVPAVAPRFIRAFIASEASGGLLLMAAAFLALVVANSAAAPSYFSALSTYFCGLNLLHWVNDAMMAVFFLLVGLEIKRELLEGELSTRAQRILPGLAAAGGMIVPACVFLALNLREGGAPRGWAIPAATDIAFALGILSLLGPRVPASLKIFLTALAIIDDLGAVIIIALFYTAEIHWLALAAAGVVTGILFVLNRRGVTALRPYLVLGALLWTCVFQSGIHATLAGVILAFTIPLRKRSSEDAFPPLLRLEHGLHPWVTYLIVPIFGFANAGVSFVGVKFADLVNPITLGVTLGLFLGKQWGVFLASWIAIRCGIAAMPDKVGWGHLYGLSILCGIGFTMSLFIGLLAYDSPPLQDTTKLGVILGSSLSALSGVIVLLVSGRKSRIQPGI